MLTLRGGGPVTHFLLGNSLSSAQNIITPFAFESVKHYYVIFRLRKTLVVGAFSCERVKTLLVMPFVVVLINFLGGIYKFYKYLLVKFANYLQNLQILQINICKSYCASDSP